MYNSKLETNDNGKPFIIAYYDRDKRDWNQAIKHSLERHGYHEGAITVICKPEGKK